jgi:hypothetical protein
MGGREGSPCRSNELFPGSRSVPRRSTRSDSGEGCMVAFRSAFSASTFRLKELAERTKAELMQFFLSNSATICYYSVIARQIVQNCDDLYHAIARSNLAMGPMWKIHVNELEVCEGKCTCMCTSTYLVVTCRIQARCSVLHEVNVKFHGGK